MTKEEILAEDKRVVEEFASNPENKQKAAEIAFNIKQAFDGWFTITKLVKAFKVNQADAAQQIEVLLLLNLAVAKVKKDIPYFKIDLNKAEQRTMILEEIANKEGEIAFLKEKLVKLD